MGYTKHEVLQYVAENDVKFIKLLFTDLFGRIKSISIQPSILEKAFDEGISFDASAVPGYLDCSQSDLFLVPDPNTLCVLPWRPQQGRVVRLFCNIRYPDGSVFEGDTRNLLQNVIDEAARMGFSVNVGTECEFYLFKLDENSMPVKIPYDNATYCDLAPIDKGENVRRDIVLNLEKMGVQPETSHHEAGPGQNEIDFKYSTAMEAADNFGTFKMTVKTIAAKDGLHASFMPKPLEGKPGSGLHINLSLCKDGQNLYSTVDPAASHFTAGILNRVRDFTLFLNPMHQSYKRLGVCEAPFYVSWSKENRSQLIRLPAAKNDAKRIELRSPDPSCNQYLALSMIIAAGLEGIKNQEELPAPVNKNLFVASPEDVKDLETLPSTMDEAIKLASGSSFVKSVLGEKMLNSYVSIKKNWVDPEFGVL